MSKKRRILTDAEKTEKKAKKWSAWNPVRLHDLIELFGDRYGGGNLFVFPDDDAGREDLRILLDHYSLAYPHAMPRVVRARAPWLTGVERDDSLQEVTRHPRYWPARELAIKLNLYEAKRIDLGISTIAAVDVSDKERERLRKVRNTELQRAKRLAKGATPRAQSKSRRKEWEALGISRRTFYRRLANGTDSSAAITNSDSDGTDSSAAISLLVVTNLCHRASSMAHKESPGADVLAAQCQDREASASGEAEAAGTSHLTDADTESCQK
jgi:hypothetical protein